MDSPPFPPPATILPGVAFPVLIANLNVKVNGDIFSVLVSEQTFSHEQTWYTCKRSALGSNDEAALLAANGRPWLEVPPAIADVLRLLTTIV